jgi:poly(3-hydroxybutyrate) depolymerase
LYVLFSSNNYSQERALKYYQQIVMILVVVGCVVVTDARAQDGKSIPVLQSDGDLKLKPGSNLLEIKFKGVVRDLFIEMPADMKKGERYPVVFGFHGDGGPKEAYNRRLSPYVKKYQIIGISIQGTPKRVGSGASSWDHHDGSDVDVDDIGFVEYLVDYLNKTERVDLKRVYATGGSSGGLFCYRLAKETKLFAAIGPTKCGMIKGSHEPDSNTVQLSVMQVIGNKDKSFNGSSKRLTMYSAEQRIEIWRKFLDCSPKPSVNSKIEGMTIKTYANDKGHEVVYCMLHGVGHGIPKPIIPVMDGLIVDFFMRHKKP